MKASPILLFPWFLAWSACTPLPPEPKEPQSTPSAKTAENQPQTDPRYASLPQPGPAPAWAPPAATRSKLDNGLAVWTMSLATAPLVSVQLVLPSGSADDPENKTGLSMLAADMLDEGAGNLSALELSDRLGELATDYSSAGGVDNVVLSMSCLAENLEPSLALLADIVQRPRLLRAEFERRKDHYKAAALAAQDNPREARRKGLYRSLFATGYASVPPDGTLESIEKISHADIKLRVREMAVPEGAHLTLAGKITAPRADELAKKYFGAWKGKRISTPRPVADPPQGGAAAVIDFPGAAQSSLAIAMRSGPLGTPDEIAEQVMNEKIGGSFTGRINMNLREDKGYTYGAFGVFRRFREAGFYAILADVKSETTGPSIREVFSELTALCSKSPLTQQERNEAVEGMLLGFPLNFDNVGSIGDQLSDLAREDRSTDYWTQWPSKVSAITVERANEEAKPYCDPKSYVVVVAGDQAKVAPELEKLGLRVSKMNRDGQLLDSEPQE